MAISYGVMFVSLQTYYKMATFFGGHDGLQWFFAVMCVFALIFIYFFLPETHGKSLLEIEDYFNHHTVYKKSKGKKSKKGSSAPGSERLSNIKTLGVMESLSENQAEYDSLIIKSEKKCPKIVKKDSNVIGGTDVRNLDYIDKSATEIDKISTK